METPKQIESKKVEKILKRFRSWESAFTSKDIVRKSEVVREFIAGNQWNKSSTPFPKPVYNIMKMNYTLILSSLANNPIKNNFISFKSPDKAAEITSFNLFQSKERNQDAIDIQWVSESIITGTSIMYYYWDENAVGNRGEKLGGLRSKILFLEDVAVSNINEFDIQKNEWIIRRYRLDTKKVKKLCENKANIDLIEPDGYERAGYEELSIDEKTTVYVMFYRKDREVYHQMCTSNVLVYDEKPLNPYINKRKQVKSLSEKFPKLEFNEEDYTIEGGRFGAYLYPFEFLRVAPNFRSCYGDSLLTDIVEVQKTINFNEALATMNNLNTGSPKIVAKQDALQGQVITNEVGEIITDHTPPGTKGLDYLQTSPVTAGAVQLAPNSVDMIRTIKGTTEVANGEINASNMSGYALSILNANSEKPRAMERKNIFEAKKNCGKIELQFYLLNYENKRYDYLYQLNEKLPFNNGLVQGEERLFNGFEFQDIDFDIMVEAAPYTQFSMAQTISQLDTFLQNGFIDFQTYLSVIPESELPIKSKLIEAMAIRQQSNEIQLQQQLAQKNQDLEQMSAYTSELEKSSNEYRKQAQQAINNQKSMYREYMQNLIQMQGQQTPQQQQTK